MYIPSTSSLPSGECHVNGKSSYGFMASGNELTYSSKIQIETVIAIESHWMR